MANDQYFWKGQYMGWWSVALRIVKCDIDMNKMSLLRNEWGVQY
jgi:hypothetical protein